MTAKEKAKEIAMKFDKYGQTDNAVKCTLICVDEILEFAYDIEWEKKEEAMSKLKFLKEVREEIIKI
jgi:hypothetical protein